MRHGAISRVSYRQLEKESEDYERRNATRREKENREKINEKRGASKKVHQTS
jgi:hypothetical protein